MPPGRPGAPPPCRHRATSARYARDRAAACAGLTPAKSRSPSEAGGAIRSGRCRADRTEPRGHSHAAIAPCRSSRYVPIECGRAAAVDPALARRSATIGRSRCSDSDRARAPSRLAVARVARRESSSSHSVPSVIVERMRDGQARRCAQDRADRRYSGNCASSGCTGRRAPFPARALCHRARPTMLFGHRTQIVQRVGREATRPTGLAPRSRPRPRSSVRSTMRRRARR